ncbi:pyridoxal 5'-phosphate synthase glutaminase subunit PdxT, partial [Salmonella enterica subsp. enterica serovar Derby]
PEETDDDRVHRTWLRQVSEEV